MDYTFSFGISNFHLPKSAKVKVNNYLDSNEQGHFTGTLSGLDTPEDYNFGLTPVTIGLDYISFDHIVLKLHELSVVNNFKDIKFGGVGSGLGFLFRLGSKKQFQIKKM